MNKSNFEQSLLDKWNATIKEALAPYVGNLYGGRVNAGLDAEVRSLYKLYKEERDEPKTLNVLSSLLERLNKCLDEALFPKDGRLFLLPDFRVYRRDFLDLMKEETN